MRKGLNSPVYLDDLQRLVIVHDDSHEVIFGYFAEFRIYSSCILISDFGPFQTFLLILDCSVSYLILFELKELLDLCF